MQSYITQKRKQLFAYEWLNVSYEYHKQYMNILRNIFAYLPHVLLVMTSSMKSKSTEIMRFI